MAETLTNAALALALAGRGWHIFPCKPDKSPYTARGHLDATRDPSSIRGFWVRWPGALVGVNCERSGIFAVDVDVDPEKGINGFDTWHSLANGNEQLVSWVNQKTPRGGFHLIFRMPADVKIPNKAGALGHGVDTRSTGYICTGGPYTWLRSPLEYDVTDAPEWLLDRFRALQKPAAIHHGGNGRGAVGSYQAGKYWLDHFLQLAQPGSRNDKGFELACQLRDSNLSKGEAEVYMLAFAASVPQVAGDPYTDKQALDSLNSAYSAPAREPATLPGGENRPGAPGNFVPDPPEWSAPGAGEPAALKIHDQGTATDDANAIRLARHCSGRALYVASWGWMVYDGKRWAQDENGVMLQMARNTARGIYEEAAEAAKAGADDAASRLAKWAGASLNYSRITAMISLAQSDLPARTAEFDADPYLLAVNNGVLNLRTGQLLQHDAKYRITRLAPVDYDPAAQSTAWGEFLARIFNNDAETIDYLRRAVGYSLTGDVSEQCLFFLYGIGANGKSTFTGAIQAIMGDYSMKSRAETLMLRRNDAIPEEIAQLAGVRFMLAAELGEGQRLNESLVKDITGGDAIRGRLLYRTSFEYRPAAKPWLYGNHRPIIHGTDLGIWRRVKLVPFTVTIPEKERDPHLARKLEAELPGILNWAVSGCLDWQRSGLAAPASVQAATQEYRQSQDILAAFLSECTISNSLATVTAVALYTAYKTWATESGINAISKIGFSRQLAERGITTAGREGGSGRVVYSGLGLLAE